MEQTTKNEKEVFDNISIDELTNLSDNFNEFFIIEEQNPDASNPGAELGTFAPPKTQEEILASLSPDERFHTSELMKLDLNGIKTRLDNIPVREVSDFGSGFPAINASARLALVRDASGNVIEIDNHAEIKRMQMKNSGRAQQASEGIDNSTGAFDPNIDDDLNLNFDFL